MPDGIEWKRNDADVANDLAVGMPLATLAAPSTPTDLVALDVTGDGRLGLLAATPGRTAGAARRNHAI